MSFMKTEKIVSRRQKGRRIVALLLGTAMVTALAGCGKEIEVSDTTEKTVRETEAHEDMFDTVVRTDIYVVERGNGIIGPVTEDLTFTGSGKFQKFYVELGDSVKAGDIIATADESGLDDQVKALNKQIQTLTDNYNDTMRGYDDSEKILDIRDAQNENGFWVNYKSLKENQNERKRIDLKRKQTTELYEYNLGKLKEQLAEVNSKRSGNNIVAPFDGVILAKAELREGDAVTEDDYYVTLADTTQVRAYTDYMSSAISKLTPKVYILHNGEAYDVIYHQMDAKTYSALVAKQATMYLEFSFANPDDSLKFGDKVILVSQKNAAEDVLAVNNCALRQDTIGKYVYVNSNGNRVKKYVVTGITNGIMTEIKEGLEEGESVYVDD